MEKVTTRTNLVVFMAEMREAAMVALACDCCCQYRICNQGLEVLLLQLIWWLELALLHWWPLLEAMSALNLRIHDQRIYLLLH